MDRDADRKMVRTSGRALAIGSISAQKALLFSIFLGVFGITLLMLYRNPWAASMALLGGMIYVSLYSVLKYATVHATLIGSVAGALPPVIGYCAARNQLDGTSSLLFLILLLWQMPHFFSIAIYRMQDYANAAIPVLPIVEGIPKTKIQSLFYVLLFLGAIALLPLYSHVGRLYGVSMLLAGMAWLWVAIRGFSAQDDTLWARQMFRTSLIVITTWSVTIFCS